MPTDIKTRRAYARKNFVILRWTVQALLFLLILLVTALLGLNTINTSLKSVENDKNTIRNKLNSENLIEIQKSYNDYLNNLNTVTQILSKQILYSSLLQKIGSVIPPGATLNSINLSSTDNALELNFNISSSNLAPIIQVNLQDEKNELFEKADIIQVNCQQGQSNTDSCTTQLKAKYKKDAVFIFINTIGDKK